MFASSPQVGLRVLTPGLARHDVVDVPAPEWGLLGASR